MTYGCDFPCPVTQTGNGFDYWHIVRGIVNVLEEPRGVIRAQVGRKQIPHWLRRNYQMEL